ncbi:MAG: metal ABC transporter permease [bacterium]|nr:metal ABC transporter permease [bacterium]
MTIPLLTLFALFAVAACSGLIGSFALMRRMTLASDAMSHIALPGLAFALLLKLDPFIGGLTTLILGSLLIWGLEQKTKIATETIIGVVFSASLAIGSLLITTDHELLEALFGNVASITDTEALIGLITAFIIIIIMLFLKERLTLSIFSPDIARTTGVNNRRLSLVFLLLFAINIILGLKFLGVLLMGSLIIIPAATAKNLSRNLKSDLITSVVVALISTAGGLFIATRYNLDLGPVIIAVAALFFFISVFFAKNK